MKKATHLDISVKKLIEESNLYVQQSGQNFVTNSEEIKSFPVVNFRIGKNRLPSLSVYCHYDNSTGNYSIQAVFIRIRFQSILQSLDFTDNTSAD